MIRVSLCVAALGVFLAGTSPLLAQRGPKHVHLHHALHELRQAHAELKSAKGDFGGHREKALRDIHQAADAIEDALRAAGDPHTKVIREAALYKGYKHHPHIHHALQDLREAHHEMTKAPHDFGGKRQKALREIDQAIVQVELILKHAR